MQVNDDLVTKKELEMSMLRLEMNLECVDSRIDAQQERIEDLLRNWIELHEKYCALESKMASNSTNIFGGGIVLALAVLYMWAHQ